MAMAPVEKVDVVSLRNSSTHHTFGRILTFKNPITTQQSIHVVNSLPCLTKIHLRVLYTVMQRNCTILFLQQLCQIFLYWNNYWYKSTL